MKHQQKKNAAAQHQLYTAQHTPPQHVPYTSHTHSSYSPRPYPHAHAQPPPRGYVHPSLGGGHGGHFNGLTLPPLYHNNRRPPSPTSSASGSGGTSPSIPSIAPLRPLSSWEGRDAAPPRYHPHHLPPTSSLRSSQAQTLQTPVSPQRPSRRLSISTTPAPALEEDGLARKLILLASANGGGLKPSDVAADVLATALGMRDVVDALFVAAGLVLDAPSPTSSGVKMSMLPTPVSVGGLSPRGIPPSTLR